MIKIENVASSEIISDLCTYRLTVNDCLILTIRHKREDGLAALLRRVADKYDQEIICQNHLK